MPKTTKRTAAARKLDFEKVDVDSKIVSESKKPKLDHFEEAAKVKSFARLNALLAKIPAPKKKLKAGTAVKPMLAKASKSIQEVLNSLNGNFTCEWKYDGERVQLHVDANQKISLYSRNLNDSTGRYQDIARTVTDLLAHPACKVKSCILDCEACPYDVANDKLLPFQALAKRKRKDQPIADIDNGTIAPVCVYAFDLLELNGVTLASVGLARRREIMQEAFPTVLQKFQFAKYQNCRNSGDVEDALNAAIADGTEGLMVKGLSDAYKPGSRTADWRKLKKDYLDGMGDTLDLVPIGAWRGNGSRASVYGSFLLAAREESTGKLHTVTKVGTGFTNQDLAVIKKKLNSRRIASPKAEYVFERQPKIDEIVWFDTDFVWEVKCADLQLSSTYTAARGTVQASKGISLRFPRYVKLRRDKSLVDATTCGQILDMYKAQPIFNQK